MKYDVIIIGAGPGGIFAAYELMKKKQEYKIAVFEEGYTLKKRKCPIDGDNNHIILHTQLYLSFIRQADPGIRLLIPTGSYPYVCHNLQYVHEVGYKPLSGLYCRLEAPAHLL